MTGRYVYYIVGFTVASFQICTLKINIFNGIFHNQTQTPRSTRKTTDLGLKNSIGSSGVPRVSRAMGQSQFGHPHPGRWWQHRCQEWVGSKGTSKVDSGPASSCLCRSVSKFPMTVMSQNIHQDLWILEIINHRSVKNLIVLQSREASPTLKFRLRLNFQTVVLRHSKLRYYIRIVTTSERKCKN